MRKTRWQCREKQAALAAMSDMGMSAAEIAKKIGETRAAVNWALDRYGLRAVRAAPRWQCPKKQTALAEMSDMGLSAADIAETIGETRDAVKNVLDRYGLYAVRRGSCRPVTLAERAGL
jgi:hypothetical protein